MYVINYDYQHRNRCSFQRNRDICTPFSHSIASPLQHSSSKNRHKEHSQNTHSCLASLRNHNTSRRTRTTTRTSASCPARGRASSSCRCTRRGRGVVTVAEDSSGRDAILHEAALQVRHSLLDRQTVVAAVAVERLDGRGLAALREDGGGIACEVRGGAADCAGDVLCRELVLLVERIAGGRGCGIPE